MNINKSWVWQAMQTQKEKTKVCTLLTCGQQNLVLSLECYKTHTQYTSYKFIRSQTQLILKYVHYSLFNYDVHVIIFN